MAVLRTKLQASLEMLRARLLALEPSIPRAAEKARHHHRGLTEEVTAKLASWRPRWDPGGLEDLEAAVVALEALVGEIEGLVDDASSLRHETGELKGRAQQFDAGVVDWIEARCSDWDARLARIAAEVDRGEDVADERRRLEALEAELRRTFQALFWLGELHAGMAAFREGIPHSAEALVGDLGRALLREGVTDDWLRRVEMGSRRLGEIRDEETRRPPELGAVARLLPSLRGWSQTLALFQTEVRDLERRFRGVVVADWATLPPRLEQEAKLLEEKLRGRAEAQRRDGMSDLRRKVVELIGLCGHQPALAQEVAALEGRTVSRPQNHQHWLRDHARALERLGAIASSHRGQLELLLGQRCTELEEALVALRADPMSDAVSAGAHQVEQALSKLGEPTDIETVVASLCRAGELLNRVRDLAAQATEELASLRDRQKQLRLDSAALREAMACIEAAEEALRTVDLDPDFDLAIDALTSRVGAKASLELALQAAARLESQLADQRQGFGERCRGRFEARAATFHDLRGSLLLLDPTAEIPSLAHLPADVSPAEAVAVLRVAETLLADLDQRATTVEIALQPRRQSLVAKLAALAAPGLDPGDRERVERLMAELAAPPSEGLGTSERLRLQGGSLAEGEALVARHEAAERAVAERRHTLERRLETCRDQGLDASYGHWWQRATALVYGLPDPPTSSPDHRGQLDQAEILCTRLELASRWVAATDFAHDIASLRRQPDGPALRALIVEVEAVGESTFPALDLRRRVRRALGDGKRRSDR